MNECRICFDEEKDSEFINPCKCNSWVHKECIKNWILSENNNSPTECEVCLQEYSIDFGKLFADQLRAIRERRRREEEEEHSSDGVDIEMGGSYASIGSEPDQIVSQNIHPLGSHERVRIARRVLHRLLRKDREIKERSFILVIMGFLFDGFMAFSYYEICDSDRQCRFDVVSAASATTGVWSLLLSYQIYLYYHYRRLRDNIMEV